MNLLYSGKYKQRFAPVISHLAAMPSGSRILELCFGDIYIADYCRKAGYEWTGFDINEHFIDRAQKLGFDAHYANLSSTDNLPQSDVCLMMGSLYHFHLHAEELIAKMLIAARIVVISEPILNLASRGGLIGYLARRSANAGKGNESFRYNRKTFTDLIDRCRSRLNIGDIVIQDHGKDIIVKLVKNGNYQP
jgi:hypothetical protein